MNKGYAWRRETKSLPQFGKFLRERLDKMGRKQRDLAHILGVSPATVSNWVGGRFPPRRNEIVKLAAFLGCTTDEIFKHLG